MDNVQNITGVTAEAIKSCDNQLVTFTQKLDDCCQLGSALTACTGDLFAPDDLATFGNKSLLLNF